MDQPKQHSSDDGEPKKMKNTTNRLSRARFEDLSNEMIYEIFDLLDGCHNYEAFSNLNTRFDRLLQYLYRLKINILFPSKVIFQHRCTKVIGPNIERIISLHLSTALSIDLFLKSFSINSFIRLESLTLDSIQPNAVEPLLLALAFLPRLFSLSITGDKYVENEQFVIGLIFNLSTLKYVKYCIPPKCEPDLDHYFPLSIASIGQQQNETIRHLTINRGCYVDQLGVLSCVPKLQRLSCEELCEITDISANTLMTPTFLTHISINKRCRLSFDNFELFISKLCSQLRMLRLKTDVDTAYLDADRWQHFILHHLPKLRIFDFEYRCYIALDDHQYTAYHAAIDRFTSSFWLERQWHFAHEHFGGLNCRSAKFYSIEPYRRQQYELCGVKDDYVCPYRDSGFNSACQIVICDYEVINNCLLRFPQATKLNFFDKHESSYLPIADLNRIVPLANLNQVVLDVLNIDITQLLEFLHNAPNIRSLKFSGHLRPSMNSLSLDHMENAHAMPRNNLVSLFIELLCSFKHLRLFMNIFPHLEHLQLGSIDVNYESLLRFLLLENQSNRQHLCSLYFKLYCSKDGLVEQLKAFIDNEKLLDDYSITYRNGYVRLWW